MGIGIGTGEGLTIDGYSWKWNWNKCGFSCLFDCPYLDMGFTPFVEKNVNSDLKNGMQQHDSVFRIPEEITSLDYFSLSSTDSFSNMEEEIWEKKHYFYTMLPYTR